MSGDRNEKLVPNVSFPICLGINLTEDRDYIRQDLYWNEKFFAYVNSNIHVLADILLIVLSS